jgi:hypothetical protein
MTPFYGSDVSATDIVLKAVSKKAPSRKKRRKGR